MSKKITNPTTLARALAPEDIRPRMYVAVLHEVNEWLPCFTVEDVRLHDVEPLRVAFLPDDRQVPLEVVDVCLPFVRVRSPDRAVVLLDVRRYRLARLDEGFARRTVKAMRVLRNRKKNARKGKGSS